MPGTPTAAEFAADVLALAGSAELIPDAAAQAERLGNLVRQRWSQPQRSYHDARHLGECLTAYDLLADRANPGYPLGRVALWYHDAVYEPGRADNEAASARLAEADLSELGMPSAPLEQVARLILETTDHALPLAGSPSAWVHDADLWILSAPADRFDAYCAQVRSEYAAVPDAAYRLGRSQILGDLAGRPTLYAEPLARAEWEPRARANLARELARLS